MARLISLAPPAWRQWVLIAGLGVAMGLVFCLLSLILDTYVIQPLACGTGEATQCVNAHSLSTNIAMVLGAVVAIWVASRLGVMRPLLVVIGATALLWGLGDWINGLSWIEALGWSLLVYVLAYLLFGGLSRNTNVATIIFLILIIVAAERIVLTF